MSFGKKIETDKLTKTMPEVSQRLFCFIDPSLATFTRRHLAAEVFPGVSPSHPSIIKRPTPQSFRDSQPSSRYHPHRFASLGG